MIAFFVDGPLMGRQVQLAPTARQYVVAFDSPIDAAGPNAHLLPREPVDLTNRTATYHLHFRHEQNGESFGVFALDMRGLHMALLLWMGVLASLNAGVQSYIEARA